MPQSMKFEILLNLLNLKIHTGMMKFLTGL
jgi:hypothetical protein